MGEREAIKVTEQQAAQQWIITVNGISHTGIKPGQSVEIGRKPIRPLADDGFTRIEIEDSTRSMSKRHALFTVSETGTASVRDMNSTNGSYAVMHNGELMRLKANEDVPLPSSPFRLQFGDVPVDFIRIETNDIAEDDAEVPDLFTYASDENKPEPDAADMSVDDILDLRAGEPTSMFRAKTVSERISELQAASMQTFQPLAQSQSETSQDSSQDLANALAGANGDEEAAHPVEALSLNITQPGLQEDPQPRDLFADAQTVGQNAGFEAETEESASELPAVETTMPIRIDAQTNSPVQERDSVESDEANSQAAAPVEEVRSVVDTFGLSEGEPAQDADTAQDTEGADADELAVDVAAENTDESDEQSDHDGSAQTAAVFTPIDDSVADGSVSEGAGEDHDRYRQASTQSAATAFTPVFEPGSVFDRVSKGEISAREPSVEVDGLTSDDAKRTGDFRVQFEMARHPQLLPFLAMNPSLYDDLYAWLAAQGNSDIDEALAHNAGYAEYLKAVGK